MRIVAGALKGRRIDGPSWDGLRPTSDSLRETLFNVLGPTLDGCRVLDAFAGTGAVGIEAISRGASHVTFLDSDSRAITLVKRNIAHCGVENACAIIRDDFMTPRARNRVIDRFDLVFLDPPYEGMDAAAIVDAASQRVTPGGRVVIEHSRRATFPESASGLARWRLLEAGDSALSFYKTIEAP
jgi:16S rRNA (guanine966-N2)-methyltransferase